MKETRIANFGEREIKLRVDEEGGFIAIVQTQPDKIHDGMVWEQDWISYKESNNKEQFIKETVLEIYFANGEENNINFLNEFKEVN